MSHNIEVENDELVIRSLTFSKLIITHREVEVASDWNGENPVYNQELHVTAVGLDGKEVPVYLLNHEQMIEERWERV